MNAPTRMSEPPIQNPTATSFTSLTLLGKVRDLSDQQAWSEFVQVYTPRIFSWCKRFSLQDQDAADVTQQVLLKLVTAMQSFEYDSNRGSFRGWLKTVTANAVRDIGRKKSSSDVVGQKAEPWLDKLADNQSIDLLTDEIEAGFRQEILAEAEARAQLRLKPQTWEIYCLLTKQDKSATEVAQSLNIKVADTYVAKSRAIKMLKEIVSQLERLN
jgi:RNA polymerase sigma-70 factor (ECF subfamily)